MRDHPCIARVGLIFFWCEGCFWFECLPSLSSACAVLYPLDRGCAGAWPYPHALRKAGAAGPSCLSSPRWQQQLAPGARVGSALLQRKKLLWRSRPSPCALPNNGTLPLFLMPLRIIVYLVFISTLVK